MSRTKYAKHIELAESAAEADDVGQFLSSFRAIDSDRVRKNLVAFACAAGAGSILTILIDEGVIDVNFDVHGSGLLDRAIIGGNESTVRLLLEKGAPRSETSLVSAVRTGCLPIVRLLVNAGADIEFGLPGFPTPLGAARSLGLAEIERFLLELGAREELGADD